MNGHCVETAASRFHKKAQLFYCLPLTNNGKTMSQVISVSKGLDYKQMVKNDRYCLVEMIDNNVNDHCTFMNVQDMEYRILHNE